MNWEDLKVGVFVNNKLMTTQPFHMGQDPFASGQGLKTIFTDVDSLVLYTLSAGGKSEFSSVKLCEEKCSDFDYLLELNALLGISDSSKILIATLIIYISMLQMDSTD